MLKAAFILLLFLFPLHASSYDECFETYSEEESLTAPDWYNNTETELIDRYSWWRSRKKFQPLAGESTVIAGVVYTQSNSVLKITVLFPPLYPDENRIASLQVNDIIGREAARHQTCEIKEYTWHCTFKIDYLPGTKYYTFYVFYEPSPVLAPGITYAYPGVIPRQRAYPRVAAMGCFGPDNTWKKDELVGAILKQNPDVLILQGDQGYYSKNLAHGFLELVYSMNKLTRIIPTIVQMDDHDYGLGNLWGAEDSAEDSGAGFGKAACVVNAIEDMVLGHMPDAGTKKTLSNGIGIRYTNYVYGIVDFAVLEARKFKNKFGTSLLGTDQEEWLNDWCNKEEDQYLKVVLAQTPFASLATNATSYWAAQIVPVANVSMDTNSYPPEGRTRFMEIAKDCTALVLSGDQHVGIAVTYEDYGVSECASPAAINDVFWRINVNPLGQTYVDSYGHQYTLHNVWNVNETYWSYVMPDRTVNYSNEAKHHRADGFLMVEIDGEKARCEMHSYRVDPQMIWKVVVPAAPRSKSRII